jgi:hypothetical protein
MAIFVLFTTSPISQRRKSALKILTQQRGLTRLRAIQYGLRNRARTRGWSTSLRITASILLVDSIRTIIGWILRLCIIYPIFAVLKSMALLKSCFAFARASKR